MFYQSILLYCWLKILFFDFVTNPSEYLLDNYPAKYITLTSRSLLRVRYPSNSRYLSIPGGICYATIGVHPCSAKTFDTYPGGPSALLEELEILALESQQSTPHAVAAFGEIGLDYDRLFLCPKDQQLKYFEAQLDLAIKIQLPLFLHSRAASADFERLIRQRLTQLPKKGLVHSFTGTIEEMQRLVEMGFDIGINGCSMKTEENIEVVRAVPLDRLQIETDGPWCEMRPSHASAIYTTDALSLPKSVKKEKWQRGLMVKGRNEPVTIRQVAYAIAAIKGKLVNEVCEAAWRNSIKMFGLGESLDEKSKDKDTIDA